MISKIPKTTIAFHGGAYGNYIKWILYSLLVDEKIVSPFLDQTSHNFNYLSSKLLQEDLVIKKHTTLCQLMKNNKLRLSTIHPVTSWEMDFIDEVDKISKLVDRVIIPYIDHSTYLLGVHNFLYKIYPGTNIWDNILKDANREDITNGWGVDPGVDLNTVSRWILREYHSLSTFESWESACGWFAPDQGLTSTNCQFVFISDLFYNFLPTIESIRQFLEVEWVRDSSELLPYHKTNVSKQQYKNQDLIAKQILQSIADDTDFTWNADSITLYTEAYIQRALQQQGIMLKCNGLNDFPTSTKALIEVFE